MKRSAVFRFATLTIAAAVAVPIASDGPRAEVSRAQQVRVRVFKLLNDGIQAHKEGRQKDAIPLLEEAAGIALNSFRAYYYLGLALKADRQYKRAVEPLQVALELDPVNLQARVALGDCYLQRGDPAEALAEYHRALSLQSDYAPAYDGLGRAAESSGDVQKAIEHYRKAIELNPGYPDAAIHLGDLFLRDGRLNEAIDLFLTAIKVRPDFAAAYNRLGVAYARQRLSNEAIAALRQAETLERGNSWHPVTIGGIFQDLGFLVQARREFDKALELDADFLEGYLARAGLERREGDFEKALANLDAGLKRNVDDPHNRARLEETREKFAEEAARMAALQARLEEERSAATLVELADLKADLGDHAGAVSLLQEAVGLGGDGAAPAALLSRLGYSALMAEMYPEASAVLQRVVALSPSDADAFVNLGLARMGLGEMGAAEEALKEASRLRPGDPRPLAYLGNLYVVSGRPHQAIESLDASLGLMPEVSAERQRVQRLLDALRNGPSGSGS